MPIQNHLFDKLKKVAYFAAFSEQNIPNDTQENELTALEEVLMIGYPKGLSDTFNNIPITRKGLTATPYFIDYNKQKRFLLDIPIYPGSSGSPIVIYNSNGYADKSGTLNIAKRFLFIGVAVQSKEYMAKGAVSNTNNKVRETTTWLPFEIAIVVKSAVLLDFKPILEQTINDNNYTSKYLKSLLTSY